MYKGSFAEKVYVIDVNKGGFVAIGRYGSLNKGDFAANEGVVDFNKGLFVTSECFVEAAQGDNDEETGDFEPA